MLQDMLTITADQDDQQAPQLGSEVSSVVPWQVWQGKLKLSSQEMCSASMQGLTGAPGSLSLITHLVSP